MLNFHKNARIGANIVCLNRDVALKFGQVAEKQYLCTPIISRQPVRAYDLLNLAVQQSHCKDLLVNY